MYNRTVSPVREFFTVNTFLPAILGFTHHALRLDNKIENGTPSTNPFRDVGNSS